MTTATLGLLAKNKTHLPQLVSKIFVIIMRSIYLETNYDQTDSYDNTIIRNQLDSD